MSILENLSLGFATAFTSYNLMLAFTGCLVGSLIGVLPGVGPLATIAMLLPLTYHFPAESALIMLSGVYYGAQYGGSTTAILVNLPGESSSAVTCIDGYQMARNGRAGAALCIAALASFFAGTVATLVIALLADPLASIALRFSSADYFSLMLLGLVGATTLSSGSILKSVGMVLLGILLGLVGIEADSGAPRFTLGYFELMNGIDFVAIAIGFFGIAEILANLMRDDESKDVQTAPIGKLWPNRLEFVSAVPAAIRGTVVGVLGILPGGGALLSSYTSYALERKISKTPGQFGRGAVEGVAGPEAANNAGAQMSFIPMLTLGIPSNAMIAMLMGAMMMQGIIPGPRVMTQNPELVWGLIASMWIGNLMLVVINLPLVGVWVALLRIPYSILFPAIILFCCIGAYSVENSAFTVGITAVMAILGLVLMWFGCPPAPLSLGFILGPMLEEYFRRALTLSNGELSVFVTSPISLAFIILTALLAIGMISPAFTRMRDEAFVED